MRFWYTSGFYIAKIYAYDPELELLNKTEDYHCTFTTVLWRHTDRNLKKKTNKLVVPSILDKWRHHRAVKEELLYVKYSS